MEVRPVVAETILVSILQPQPELSELLLRRRRWMVRQTPGQDGRPVSGNLLVALQNVLVKVLGWQFEKVRETLLHLPIGLRQRRRDCASGATAFSGDVARPAVPKDLQHTGAVL